MLWLGAGARVLGEAVGRVGLGGGGLARAVRDVTVKARDESDD